MVLQVQHRDTRIEKNKIITFEKFNLKGDRKKIFKVLDCHEESPVYEEMLEVYEKTLEEANKLINPKAALYIEENYGQYDIKELQGCKEIIYNCLTIGEAIPRQIASKFEEGEYLEGMVLDAIGDCFAFEIFDEVYKEIYEYLKVNECGAIRLSPGERGFDIEHHKLIKEKLNMVETIGVDISGSCMLQPVKSTSSVFIVDTQIKLSKKMHECKKCPDLTCKWRQEPYEDKNSESN